MGEARQEIPAGSQLLLMPQPREDEISIIDVWRILARRKGLMWGVFFLVTASGAAFALLSETRYQFRASVEIGEMPTAKGREVLEDPETVLAKISESFVPGVVSEFVGRKPEYRNRIEINARIPKESELVIVEAEAPDSMGVVYLDLIGKVLSVVEENHGRIADNLRSGAEARLAEGREAERQLIEERSLLEQELRDLSSGEGALGTQIREIRERVNEARAQMVDYQDGGDAQAEPGASLRAGGEQIREYQALLMNLESDLRSRRSELRERIRDVRTDIREQRELVAEAERDLVGIRETKAVQRPMQLPEPVGPRRGLIIAAAGAIGMLLGMLAALFAEFLSRVREADSA